MFDVNDKELVTKKINQIVQKVWGFEAPHPFQRRAARLNIKGRNVFVLAATSAGKSLTFQIPGMILPGTCVVISPLIALMQDQVARLKSLGIEAMRAGEEDKDEDLRRVLARRPPKFLYVSPEKLRSGSFIDALTSLKVNVFAVDESLPYDAVVVTDSGPMRIGDIVTGRLPVRAMSRGKNGLEWRAVTDWMSHPPRSRMCRIVHERGVIHATQSHVFITPNGDVRAADLTGHSVLTWEPSDAKVIPDAVSIAADRDAPRGRQFTEDDSHLSHGKVADQSLCGATRSSDGEVRRSPRLRVVSSEGAAKQGLLPQVEKRSFLHAILARSLSVACHLLPKREEKSPGSHSRDAHASGSGLVDHGRRLVRGRGESRLPHRGILAGGLQVTCGGDLCEISRASVLETRPQVLCNNDVPAGHAEADERRAEIRAPLSSVQTSQDIQTEMGAAVSMRGVRPIDDDEDSRQEGGVCSQVVPAGSGNGHYTTTEDRRNLVHSTSSIPPAHDALTVPSVRKVPASGDAVGEDVLREAVQTTGKLVASKVLSVEVIDTPDVVYDLTVEENHNFVVDGVLVHNCHMLSVTQKSFRPSYAMIGQIRRKHFSDIPCIAVTATATRLVEADVVQSLGMDNYVRVAVPPDRLNLTYEAVRDWDDARILNWLTAREAGRAPGSTIVYAATRAHVDELTRDINDHGIPALAYHAGMRDEDRKATYTAWMAGRPKVIVATNAFGMGVDKANVRNVVHADVPQDVLSYYQEAGRGGRDGKPAHCLLNITASGLKKRRMFIRTGNPAIQFYDAAWKGLIGEQPRGSTFVLGTRGVQKAIRQQGVSVSLFDLPMLVPPLLAYLEFKGAITTAPYRKVYIEDVGNEGAFARWCSREPEYVKRAKNGRAIVVIPTHVEDFMWKLVNDGAVKRPEYPRRVEPDIQVKARRLTKEHGIVQAELSARLAHDHAELAKLLDFAACKDKHAFIRELFA